MSTNPIEVVEAAVLAAEQAQRQAHGPTYWGYREYARVAVEALPDERIVANAVQALKADGWEETHEGPLGIGTLSDDDLRNIALAVLRSVGGA